MNWRLFRLFAFLIATFNVAFVWAADELVEVELKLQIGELPVQKDLKATTKLVLRSLDHREVLQVGISGVTAKVSLPAGSKWKVEAESEGFWSGGILIDLTAPQRSMILTLWPAAKLIGQLRIEPTEERYPTELKATFESSQTPPAKESAPAISPSEVVCPIAQDGFFECLLPASTLDVRLRSRGHISHYLWGLDLAPGQRKNLGDLDLKQGASLAGLAISASEAWNPKKANARLIRKVISGGFGKALRQIERSALVMPLENNGFFHFEGVSPGTYVLEIDHPQLATAVLPYIEIIPNAETQLRESLELLPPVQLELDLIPPRDWLDQSWHVTILRASSYTAGFDEKPAFRGKAVNGKVLMPGQAPGVFSLLIEDSKGNRFHSNRSLLLDGSGIKRHSIDLAMVVVTGEAFLGDEPLTRSTLYFGGQHGAERARMETDDAGNFQGVLPREGSWTVEAIHRQLDLSAKVEVEVEPNKDIEIWLPDTEVFGRVIDDEGRPVSKARVTLQTPSGKVHQQRTGMGGDFLFRGFDNDFVDLSARLEQGQVVRFSKPETLQVHESLPAGPVQLILDGETRILEGRLVSARGPVPGARIQLAAETIPSLPTMTRTGLDGTLAPGCVPTATE